MGNRQGAQGAEGSQEIDLDRADLEEYRALYRQFSGGIDLPLRQSSQLQRNEYKVDETDEDYVVYTNNLFESKIQKKIAKHQNSFYGNYYRKQRALSSKKLSKRLDKHNHLMIPPSQNFSGKILQNMLPNNREEIDDISSPVYNVLFSQNVQNLLVTTQESLYVYELNEGSYKRGKVLNPRNITWTITDSDLSSSGRFLIHCSLNPFVSLFDITKGQYLNFYNLNDTNEEINDNYWSRLRFFSCKFSGDDTRILTSSGVTYSHSYIKVFDVAGEQVIDSIEAHDNDINSIAFLNKHSSSVFISGSDDNLVKIWDTRALGPRGQSAGTFIGHVAGITHVDSRQDHYYIASNSKDSSIKLWDLRKSESSAIGKNRKDLSFDYRGRAMNDRNINLIRGLKQKENFDNSVKTFRGHKVGQTLMRCHFSPLELTDRRYIYVASFCGKVFIYDILSGETQEGMSLEQEKNGYTAAVLDDKADEPMRDAAWNPEKMEIISTNLKGNIYRWFSNQLYSKTVSEEEERIEERRRNVRGRFTIFQEHEEDPEDLENEQNDSNGSNSAEFGIQDQEESSWKTQNEESENIPDEIKLDESGEQEQKIENDSSQNAQHDNGSENLVEEEDEEEL